MGMACLAYLANAQQEPRLGSDGRPLLNKPVLELCMNRTYHEKYEGHHYFLSWREPWHKFEVKIFLLGGIKIYEYPIKYCFNFMRFYSWYFYMIVIMYLNTFISYTFVWSKKVYVVVMYRDEIQLKR